MTIEVISTTEAPTEVKTEKVAEVKDTSAPEAKASEQNESTESDTEENDAKENDGDSEDKGSDEDSESKDLDSDKPRKKGGFQRRIDKLNAKAAEAERKAAYWEAQALKTAGEPKPEKVESKTVSTEGKPNPDDFDTHAEWSDALMDWKIEKREEAAKEKAAKTQLEVEQENAAKAHNERIKSFSEKHDDFGELIESLDDIPVSLAVRELIVSSDHGPALMYELAKNRAEFERINALPPLAAAREMGKFESRITSGASSEKKPEPKKITNAPKPLAPVGKGSSGSVSKSLNDPDLSQAEYERIRREQMRKEA